MSDFGAIYELLAMQAEDEALAAAKPETEVEAWARRSVEKAQAAALAGGLGNVAAPTPAETDTDRTLSDDAGRNVDRAFGR